MSEVVKGSSLILPGLGPPVQMLPQHQHALDLSSASTSCSTILSSEFQSCRRVLHHSSHTIRRQRQRVLLQDTKLQNGSFCVKHFPSSFHREAIALKQQRLLLKQKFKDAFNLDPTREPKSVVDVKSFNRPPGHDPSLITQLPTVLYQSKTRHLTAPRPSDQSTSLSALEAVQPDLKASSKPLPTINTVSEHRRAWRANRSISDEPVPSSNERPGRRFDTSSMLDKRPPPRKSKSSVRQDTARGKGRIHTRSAGTTSEAIAVLQNRLQRGSATDSSTYIKVLQMCLRQKDLSAARQVHDCIIESGMDRNPYVASTLLNLYTKCGGLLDARRVFDGLEKKSVIAWTMMIAGYANSDDAESAMEIFKLMRQEGAQPNEITYLCILKACVNPSALTWGKEVHDCLRHAGFESDVRVGTALLQMYAKCGCITEARRVFEKLISRNIVTWNIMIGSYAESGDGVEACRLFLQMQREGFEPDAITYLNILNASASVGALEWVKQVHGHAIKAGLESDLRVGGALVHMYGECGSIDDARLVFDRMEKSNVVTWNVMIGGLAQNGLRHEAYQLFFQMRQEGFEPDAYTYASILNASASVGSLEWVKEVHAHASKARLESNLRVGTALVHMYAKSGSIDDARRVFDKMGKRDVVTWSTMIAGLAYHGCGHEALALFRKMNDVKPSSITFVAVLSACCHSGLLDDGRSLFAAMRQDYGIEPELVHYTCIVDLLGRAGLLEEAKQFIREMPVEPDGIIWIALLGACRTYGNVELGELAAEELFKLKPNDDAGYVLLSNIYAAAGKWEKVSMVRTMMRERGVRKEPGRSWIEVDKQIHEFVVGDTSHPESKAIYSELNKVTEQLKAEGYIPDTRLVLHDINEEDKELALCSHSEKLAIAYGLMRVPLGEPIRVRKNLRVCPDCHTATKLISKVTGREIIARDVNRFHHFKDGVCSCGDYW